MDRQRGQGTILPDWYPDPAGRHEYRYWDGAAWTGHVADAGAQSMDPLRAGPTPATVDGPQSTDDLIAVLQDGDIEEQKRAARALGARQCAAAIDPLLRCLDADNQILRIHAMESLVMTVAAEDAVIAAVSRSGARPPYRPIETLADAVHFGALRDAPRTAVIIKRALGIRWGSFDAGILLGLLKETGDPVGAALCRAIDTNDAVAVDRIRWTL